MRDVKLYLSALALAGLASIPLCAQQPSQTPSPSNPPQSTPAEPDPGSQQTTPSQQSSPAHQQSNPAQPGAAGQQNDAATAPEGSTPKAQGASHIELRPVKGELEKKLDSKNAKAGDAVVVKTTESATTANGVEIAKGSKIVGQVVDAEAAGKGSKNSKVTILFDHAELKDGQNLPIRTVLQSVAPAEEAPAGETAAATATGGASAAPMSSPGTGAAGSGSSGSSGSGTTGGRAASPSSTGAPAQGGNASASTGTNAAAGNSAPAPGTVVARQGNIAIMTTAIPGVLIAGNVNGQPFSNASGALLGAGQNVHLDGGTHIVIAIADSGTKGSNAR